MNQHDTIKRKLHRIFTRDSEFIKRVGRINVFSYDHNKRITYRETFTYFIKSHFYNSVLHVSKFKQYARRKCSKFTPLVRMWIVNISTHHMRASVTHMYIRHHYSPMLALSANHAAPRPISCEIYHARIHTRYMHVYLHVA
jgi:hypothetical protein